MWCSLAPCARCNPKSVRVSARKRNAGGLRVLAPLCWKFRSRHLCVWFLGRRVHISVYNNTASSWMTSMARILVALEGACGGSLFSAPVCALARAAVCLGRATEIAPVHSILNPRAYTFLRFAIRVDLICTGKCPSRSASFGPSVRALALFGRLLSAAPLPLLWRAAVRAAMLYNALRWFVLAF